MNVSVQTGGGQAALLAALLALSGCTIGDQNAVTASSIKSTSVSLSPSLTTAPTRSTKSTPTTGPSQTSESSEEPEGAGDLEDKQTLNFGRVVVRLNGVPEVLDGNLPHHQIYQKELKWAVVPLEIANGRDTTATIEVGFMSLRYSPGDSTGWTTERVNEYAFAYMNQRDVDSEDVLQVTVAPGEAASISVPFELGPADHKTTNGADLLSLEVLGPDPAPNAATGTIIIQETS